MKSVCGSIARWIVLTAIGWLSYSLVRGLRTMVYLSAPLYDWTWYVPVIALLIGVPIWIVQRLPLTPKTGLALTGLLIWVCAGYDGWGQNIYLQPDNSAQVRISFWAYSGLHTGPESVLQDIQDTGGHIYLDAGSFEGEHGLALATELRALARYGIQVYLSPPLSDFLSSPVHHEWITSAQNEAAFVQHEKLTNVRGLIGDAELPLNAKLDIFGTDSANFSQTVTDLREGIATLHQRHPGLDIGVTAIWIQHLDGFDGDSDLSVLMRSPVDPPGGWDFVNVMTYSSYFPSEWRAYYVYLVEQAMSKRYPTRPISHLIGLVGGGFPHEPLLDFDDLVRDARLSRSLGVSEIVVFQLNGALKVFGHDFVQRLTAAVNGPQNDSTLRVPFSRPASAMLYGIATADAALDIRHPLGFLLWLGWAVSSAWVVRRST